MNTPRKRMWTSLLLLLQTTLTLMVLVLLCNPDHSATTAFVAVTPTTTKTTTTSNHHHYHQPSTQLHMGGFIVDRFSRVVKSNVNKFISNIEDPEKVINQSVIDMQKDLVKVRQSYAEAVASQRRIQRQLDEIDTTANEWYQRAQLALKSTGKIGAKAASTSRHPEQLAREALLRREMILERKDLVEKQLSTQTMVTEQLYNSIVSLEEKIREIMMKQQQLVARARTVEATKQIQSMLSNVVGDIGTATAVSNSINAFQRMEQKVEAMEAAVEATMELNHMLSSSSTTSLSVLSDDTSENSMKRSIEDDFRYLEQSSKIDEEMELLKSQLSIGTTSRGAKGLPSTTETTTTNSVRVVSIPIPQQQEQLRVEMVTIPLGGNVDL